MPTCDQFLRAVYYLQQTTPGRVARTSELAVRLGVKAPSVTVRVKKLAAARLVRYTPGRGVRLTDMGRLQAATAGQRLRLIERFLGEVLRLPADAITIEAEAVAHHVSDRVVDGIARYFDALNC